MEGHTQHDEPALSVSFNEQVVFSSRGKWLHPLFELGDFLTNCAHRPEELYLNDKVAGKAAAFLMIRLGIGRIHVRLISTGALAVFSRFEKTVTFDREVENILCKTEQLISVGDDPEQVWQMLRRRAGRVSGVELKVDGLKVALDGKDILNGVDLLVKKGESVVITGPNGAGKTTFLKAVLGLIQPKAGAIRVDERLVGSKEWRLNRSVTAYVSQSKVSESFPFSAHEVVEMGLVSARFDRTERQHRIEIAMRRTGCFHLTERPYFSLSGGEQQRISIARCLCQESGLLLFDEPTSFLDRTAKDELKDLLLELWSNEAPTIVVVTHDEHWVGQFDWPVYEMNQGYLQSINR